MSTNEFVPRYAYITDITNSNPCVVTFDDEHDFSDGEIISFRISSAYKMTELNNKQFRILSHTDDTVTLDVDTQTFTPFVLATNQQIPAQAVPSASGIIPGEYVPTMNLEDCFDNRPIS